MPLRTALPLLTLLCLPALAQQQPPQQILQTGALNAPSAVLVQDNQWSSLVHVHSTSDLDIFIEDPSTDAWLAHNAQSFLDRGFYTLTFVTFYKTPHPCHEEQIRLGFGNGANIDACTIDRYAVRTISVDAPQNMVTLLYSALVTTTGAVDASNVHRETHTRGFTELTPDAQKAISEATKLIATQVHLYAIRNHLVP